MCLSTIRLAICAAILLAAGCSAPQTRPAATRPAAPPVTSQTYKAESRTHLGEQQITVSSDGRLVERAGPFTYEGTWRDVGDGIIEGRFIEPVFAPRDGRLVRVGEKAALRFYRLSPQTRTYRWSDRLEALRPGGQ